jgi:beta-glucanase (GH16 family)
MRRIALQALLGTLLCSTPAWAEPWDKPGWNLTFHDEFDTGSLDPAKWVKRYKWGEAVINSELQAYIDDAFEFEGSSLRIVGRKESGSYAGQTMEYTSGVLSSVHEQTHGYFEIRCRMPKGKGLWPAFWLLGAVGTSGVNEIDIHEFLGHEPDKMYMTIHWGTSYSEGHESAGDHYTGPDFTQDYHTYAVDWDADRVIWYVDGAEQFQYAGPGVPQVDMYVITNLAIGGGWPGAPDDTTVFPAYYDVDYIRVYERAEEVDAGVQDAAPDTPLDAPDPSDAQESGGELPDAGVAEGDSGDAQVDLDGSAADASPESSPVYAGAGSSEGDGCACRAAKPTHCPSGGFLLMGLLLSAYTLRRRGPHRHP